MTVECLEDWHDRCWKQAMRRLVYACVALTSGDRAEAERLKREAEQWRTQADRFAALLSWELPVYGTTAVGQ